MIIEEIATISDTFKKLIQSGRYEHLILNMMNDSTKLFPDKYEHIDSQSNGECDFRDLNKSCKYDAKLLFTTEQGKLIGSRRADYEKWILTMLNEIEEFNKYIKSRGYFDVKTLTLYKIMSDSLKSVGADENVIFFIPYTIVLDGEGMIFTQFASDILSTIFSVLNKNPLIKNRMVYAIYPCLENKIAIRCLNTNIREYLANNELQKFIKYDISVDIN